MCLSLPASPREARTFSLPLGRIGSLSSFQNEVLEYYGADLLLKAMSKGMVGSKAEVAFSTGRSGVEDHNPPTVYRLAPAFPWAQSLHPLFGAW